MTAEFGSNPQRETQSTTDRAQTDSPIDVSVVIVTYNSVAFIDECLASVATGAGHLVTETIVVDNASLDGSADHIESTRPEVTLVRAGWNSGFSRACNQGAHHGRGRTVLFLNGDAQLMPGALELMIRVLADVSDVGVVAPRVVHPDGSDQQTARAFPTPAALIWGRRSPLTRRFPNSRFATRYLLPEAAEETEPFPVDWVSGAALLMERNHFLDIGGFDEGFFMYWEDADLCRRVGAAGQSVICVPEAIVVHAEGSSASTISREQNRRFHKSAYHYACKHHANGRAAVLRPAIRIVLATRSLAVSAARRRSERRTSKSAISHAGENHVVAKETHHVASL